MRFVVLFLAFSACSTAESEQWERRRDELERRKVELTALAALEPKDAAAKREELSSIRDSTDVIAFVKKHQVPVKAFIDGHAQRFTFSGTVQECRDALAPLGAMRWALTRWRLRIEGDRCDWEVRTADGVETIRYRFDTPPPVWPAPKHQVFTKNLDAVKASVARLEAEISTLERSLGSLAVMPRMAWQLPELKGILLRLQTTATWCDVPILDRELALDADQRGRLLEVTSEKLIHPLEPKSDFRLRGMIEVEDGRMSWFCENR